MKLLENNKLDNAEDLFNNICYKDIFRVKPYHFDEDDYRDYGIQVDWYDGEIHVYDMEFNLIGLGEYKYFLPHIEFNKKELKQYNEKD